MAAAFVSSTNISIIDSASFTCDYPRNNDATVAQTGQIMLLSIAWVQWTGTPAVSVSGWTNIAQALSGTSSGGELYYKQGDGTGFSATISAASGTIRATVTISLFSGTATSSPVDVTNTGSTFGSSIHSISGITTTVANDLLFAMWADVDNLGITQAGDMSIIDQLYVSPPFAGSPGRPLTTNWAIQPTAAATGARTASSFNVTAASFGTLGPASCHIVFTSIKPFNGPTTPTITAPVTGENIAIGRIYDITWNPATDPSVAQSSLTYNLDYSLNDGTSWTQIVANTSGGAITYPWNTAGLTPTSQAKIRLRAHNGTDYSVTYYITGRFTLSTDVAPLAPSNMRGEQPDGTSVSLFDIGQSLVIKGTFNDPGDVMTSFDLDWGTDGVTYGNTSTTASATLAKTYAASTFSAGTVYFRCRTEDYAGTPGPYALFSLTAAAAPAAPNITAPTFASPPTSPTPTITWTSVGQVKYRIRIVQAGVEKYNGGYVSSGSQSVTSPYSFANSTTYTLFLSIEASTGLRSTEDSETFTASYVGPLTPVLTVTAFDVSGYIELLIANPDSPAYNEIWRYKSGETTDDAIRIATGLPIDATFQDYSPVSGQGYIYFARAYLSSRGFTNSVVSSTTTLTLASLFIHVVSRTEGATSNAVSGQIVSLENLAPAEINNDILSERKKARGRTKPVTVMGQSKGKVGRYPVILTDAEISAGKETTLEAIFNANATCCTRDQRANRIFGRIRDLPFSHGHTFTGFNLEATEEDYTEAV